MSDAPTGVKHDAGKPRVDLIPPVALLQPGAVLAYGAEKYDEHNWKNHDPAKGAARTEAAMLRHLQRYKSGETHDPESGLHHLSHMVTNAMMLLEFARMRGDELPELYNPPPTGCVGLGEEDDPLPSASIMPPERTRHGLGRDAPERVALLRELVNDPVFGAEARDELEGLGLPVGSLRPHPFGGTEDSPRR